MTKKIGDMQQHAGVFVLHEAAPTLHPTPATVHTEHGLIYLVDGWFRMEHGSELIAEPGSLVVIPAGVPHRDVDGGDLDYWLAGFCATCVGLDESQLLMSPFRDVRCGALPVVTIPKARRRRLVGMFRALREECQRAAPESPELMRSWLLLLLGEARRSTSGASGVGAEGSFVTAALEFIQRHCLEPISLKDVARAVHRTPTHVAATVKQSTGYSVGEWISAGRVGEAAKRLLHTDDALETIASHVGWQDKTHFIRQFRKVYGVTPAAWRRQQRSAHERVGIRR